jgi:hypothetical protein
MQADVLLDFTPQALVAVAGDQLGRAAYLLLRLAAAVALAAGFPMLMEPFRWVGADFRQESEQPSAINALLVGYCREQAWAGVPLALRGHGGFDTLVVCLLPSRDSLWHVLFWQPLAVGPGFYLVTLLALAGALWASLALPSGALWQLLRCAGKGKHKPGCSTRPGRHQL